MSTTFHNTRRAARAGLVAAAVIAGLGVLPGCRGDRSNEPPRRFFPDMDKQPKVLPQSENEFFEDGRADRPMVSRTVPYGSTPHDTTVLANEPWAGGIVADRERMLKADETFSLGLIAGSNPTNPVYADYMPVEMSRDFVLRGQERFNIYCSACHGYTGVGDGTVGQLWSYAPANLMADLYRDRTGVQGKDGYLFHIIRQGLKNPDGTYRMPGYAHAVNEQDAWAIVAYVRALQAAQGVSFDELDPADQARLSPRGGNP